MSTNVLSAKQVRRNWHLVDAKDKILGRLATEVAGHLSGKKKPQFVPYLDSGDNVVVVNVDRVRVTGRKEDQKVYFRHSGFPGGDKRETLKQLKSRRPEEVVRHAVKGMLPKTKLGRQMIKKLYVYAGADHPYKARFKEVKDEG